MTGVKDMSTMERLLANLCEKEPDAIVTITGGMCGACGHVNSKRFSSLLGDVHLPARMPASVARATQPNSECGKCGERGQILFEVAP